MIRIVRDNLICHFAMVFMVVVSLGLPGSVGAQDNLPQPPDSVEPAAGEKEGGEPEPGDAATETPEEQPETPRAQPEPAAEVPPAEQLESEFGIDVSELSAEEVAKRLAELAKTIVDLEKERTRLQTRAETVGTVLETLQEQVDSDLPETVRAALATSLVSRTAALARAQAAVATVEEQLRRQREIQRLLARHASQLAQQKEEEQAKTAPKVFDAQKARSDADQAEREAVEAVRRARQREAQERDATVRELLARETKLAERVLELTREHGEELLRLEEETEEDISRFAEAKAELLAEIDEFPSEPLAQSRREQIDPVFQRLVSLRREARQQLSVARDLLSQAQRDVRQAQRDREKAQEAVAEEKSRRAQLESDVAKRRIAVAEAQLAVAQEEYDAAVSRRDAFQRRVDQYRARIDFFGETIQDLLPLISEKQHDSFFRINDANWQDAIAGVEEGLVRIVDGAASRLEQAKGLEWASINLWGWVWGFSWRLALALMLLRFIPPMVPDQVRRLIAALFKRRFFRARTRLTIKIGEVLNSLAYPLLALVAIRYILGVYVAQTLPEFAVLLWFVDAAFIYWIVIELTSVVVLPRWYRREQGKRSANQLLEVAEGDTEMVDLVGFEVERARKLVRSVRVVTVFWLLASYVPDLVAEVTGINIIWWVVDRVASLGFIGIVYWVISTWKDDIAALFERLASARIPGAVTFVNRQKDRPWGVLIIAFASIYVVVVELYLIVRKYVIDTEAFRRASTFAFRKKIEMQAREREEDELPDGDVGALPNEYAELFDSSPLGVDSPLYVERGSWEEDILQMYESWCETPRQGSVALVGEAGIGKTTLLMQIYEELAARDELEVTMKAVEQKHHRRASVVEFVASLFELEEVPETKVELIRDIRALETRAIVLDDCHHFFVRRIGGFDGLEALLDVVNLTDEKHFWVLTFNVFAWSYVNRVNSREHYFGRVMQLPAWSEDEIQTLIERRNAESGWATSFTDLVIAHDETDGSDYFYEVVKTARGYFRYLHEFSDGNPRVAMVFWLRSIRPQADEVMNVSLFRRPTTEGLDAISDNHWFVLTALAQHGELTADEIAHIINADPGFCHLALNYFEEKEVVEFDPETERASLAPLFFRHVLRSLMNSNYLYR